MDIQKIIEEIRNEDLNENHLLIADIIGVYNLSKLIEVFGGTQLYIPTYKQAFKKFFYRKIKAEFNGENAKELANKYNISQSTIYRLIRTKFK